MNLKFKHTFLILLFLLTASMADLMYAQSFEIRIIDNMSGSLDVQMRETTGVQTPDQSTRIVDITFTIKWLSTLNTDIDLVCPDNPYNIINGLSSKQSSGGYDYRYWNADLAPFQCPDNWIVNEWQTIGSFYTTSGSGNGDFIIADHNEYGRLLNWNQDGKDYQPIPSGSANFTFPNELYNRIWVGGASGNENDWFVSANWEDMCGEPCDIPTSLDNVLIPDVSAESGFFPETMLSDVGMYCNNIVIRDNAHLFVPTENGNLYVGADFRNYGEVRIMASADVTVSGETYIDKGEGLIINSDHLGTGSFIDNGTINYGPSGSVKVETFLENAAAAPGTFYFHQIGPTVDSPYYTGQGTGILLGSFDINVLGTWAYEWLEPTSQWNVIYWIFLEIPTTKGFILSTIDQTDHTLSMTGDLITGTVESIPLTFGGSNLVLICNPYPSSVDFDNIASGNSGLIENNYRAWDPSGSGSYATYSTQSGGTNGATQYIQVGQSVFFESKGFGTFNFENSQRNHDNAIFFKNSYIDRLLISVQGGGFSDEVIIHFMDSVTNGFDESYDVLKWTSMIPEALNLWCVDVDNNNLTIDAIPKSGMETMCSVPLNFSCHDSAVYLLNISGIETFSQFVEIWLEDLKTGGNWVNLTSSPEYEFEAGPQDSLSRFILHFHDPAITTISDINPEADIKIFSFGRNVYIINKTDEPILKYSVYALTGNEIVFNTGNMNKVNKDYITGATGYYFVKVEMTNRVFIEKVLIK